MLKQIVTIHTDVAQPKISYREKLEKLVCRKPNDKFFRSCMDQVDSLSDRQKAWINRYYYDDPELVMIWLRQEDRALEFLGNYAKHVSGVSA